MNTLSGHNNYVSSLAVSSKIKISFSGSADSTIKTLIQVNFRIYYYETMSLALLGEETSFAGSSFKDILTEVFKPHCYDSIWVYMSI